MKVLLLIFAFTMMAAGILLSVAVGEARTCRRVLAVLERTQNKDALDAMRAVDVCQPKP